MHNSGEGMRDSGEGARDNGERVAGYELDAGWDIVRPVGGPTVAGAHMAGFRCPPGGRLDMRVLPQPSVTVVLGLGGAELAIDGGDGARVLGSLVAGPDPGPTWVRGQRFACVELKLSPVAAYSLLDASPTDLHGAVTGLEDLWGVRGRRLSERLADTGAWPERFGLIDGFLAERRARAASVDAEVAASWSRVVAGRGRVRVAELAEECGWSRKRLWSRFTAQLGLTPKRAAMLVRFHCAAQRLSAGQGPVDAALACGYVDQSHLHRDVHAFTGCTPAALAGMATSVEADPVAA